MAFFSQKSEEKKGEEGVDPKQKKGAVKTAIPASLRNGLCADILLRPMITEKAHTLSSMNQYAFFVNYSVSKLDIKRAIEQIYGVHVESISTSRIKPKKRVRGKEVGYTRRMKKTIVSLRKGESIALFEGA